MGHLPVPNSWLCRWTIRSSRLDLNRSGVALLDRLGHTVIGREGGVAQGSVSAIGGLAKGVGTIPGNGMPGPGCGGAKVAPKIAEITTPDLRNEDAGAGSATKPLWSTSATGLFRV